MDANGTRFKLLLGSDDWLVKRPCETLPAAKSLECDKAGALRLEELIFEFPTPAGDRAPLLSDRRGAAADRFGNWYWIAPGSTEIRVQSIGDGITGHFWSASDDLSPPPRTRPTFGDAPGSSVPRPPLALAGLAVTDDHYLVAGTTEPGGLLVLDLRGGGGPIRSLWPATVPFAPFDLCRRVGGGVWILDRENRKLWALDRTFAVVPLGPAEAAAERSGFAPVAGASQVPEAPRPAISGSAALQLDGDPIAIDSAADGTVFLLTQTAVPPSLLQRLRDGVPEGSPLPLEDEQPAIKLAAHDLAISGDRIYVVEARGNQAYAFDLVGDRLQAASSFFPLRHFGGNAIAGGPAGPAYDSGDRFVPIVEQQRPRYQQTGSLETRVFDGGEPGCVWHRLLFDGWLPAGASVHVESRAADDANRLADATWRREPDPVERRSGPELPFLRLGPDGAPSTYELLFQAARGRHLQLRLTLEGDGRVTPRLRALRIWYPRFSYLERYLPRIYREDPESASFLDRYLANPEGLLTSLEDTIAAAEALFDPRTAPSDALDWIASFFDAALDPAWSEARRRLFLRHAIDFFALRGTMHGLRLALELAFSECADESLFAEDDSQQLHAARIVERFRARTTPALVLGDPTEADGLRLSSLSGRWTPEQGGEALHRRYTEYLGSETPVRFPLDSAQAQTRPLWARFAAEALGFEPAARAEDAGAWHAFLARRYRTIEALNSDYGTFSTGRYASFESVAVPLELPRDGAPLVDWYRFETIVLPTRRLAHRFTVLLPVAPGSTNQDHDARKALAQRIVELQKPAHTAFTVRFYWSAFRVGEARLGSDTLVDLGSRSPALLAGAVLGHSAIGESTIAGDPPTPLPAPIRQELQ